MKCKPLVSVVVITYNSSKYILETLESTRLQTYQNIELIVSDDCSTDDTVEICANWLEQNKKRFLNTEIIIPPKNTGVAINLNRGINNSAGEWIKCLSGDDILPQESIEEYIDFVTKNDYKICCCKLKMFGEDNNYIKKTEIVYNRFYEMIDRDLAYQKKMNRRHLFIPGPGLFFSKGLFEYIDGFDEKYPFAEEWPFVTKILNSGEKINLLDKHLYNYRIRNNSLCREELGMNKKVFFDMKKYIFDKVIFNLIENGDILFAWDLCVNYWYLTVKYNSEKNSALYKYANIFRMFSPIACFGYIKRKIMSHHI